MAQVEEAEKLTYEHLLRMQNNLLVWSTPTSKAAWCAPRPWPSWKEMTKADQIIALHRNKEGDKVCVNVLKNRYAVRPAPFVVDSSFPRLTSEYFYARLVLTTQTPPAPHLLCSIQSIMEETPVSTGSGPTNPNASSNNGGGGSGSCATAEPIEAQLAHKIYNNSPSSRLQAAEIARVITEHFVVKPLPRITINPRIADLDDLQRIINSIDQNVPLPYVDNAVFTYQGTPVGKVLLKAIKKVLNN